MSKLFYVDSEILERHWFNWIIARATPILEPYRSSGLLWTKITGLVTNDEGIVIKKNNKQFVDPSNPLRYHCINTSGESGPIFFQSNFGEIDENIQLPLDVSFQEQLDRYHLPSHDFYLEDGYIREVPVNDSWNEMLQQINLICCGIARKFTLRSDEERHDLAQEALIQVIGKLRRGRLVYIPGKAPVFSLLTTTIHRCMFSILNKNIKQYRNESKLAEGLTSGRIPPVTHSLCLYFDGGKEANTIKTR